MTKEEKKYDRGSSGVHSIVGEGTIFEGNISVQGSLRIDGIFKGTIKCDAFYVGRSAEVTAEVEANRSVIGGKIHGNLVSPMSAEIEETAEIIGDVRTESLTIAEKAVVHGFIDMGKSEGYKNRLASLGSLAKPGGGGGTGGGDKGRVEPKPENRPEPNFPHRPPEAKK
jgi:cytoskeletal protein CcmA (bactofilin family)